MNGKVEIDPDRRVQEAVHLVFAKMTELGSARQVLLWFRGEKTNLLHWFWGDPATTSSGAACIQLDLAHASKSDVRRCLCIRQNGSAHQGRRGPRKKD